MYACAKIILPLDNEDKHIRNGIYVLKDDQTHFAFISTIDSPQIQQK